MLDRIHKAILRLLIKYKNKTLSINQIAKKTGYASLTIKRRLENLEQEGYVYFKEKGKVREYARKKKVDKSTSKNISRT